MSRVAQEGEKTASMVEAMVGMFESLDSQQDNKSLSQQVRRGEGEKEKEG